MKKISKMLFSRLFVMGLAIVVQFLWLLSLMYQVSIQFTYVNIALNVLAVIMTLVIVGVYIGGIAAFHGKFLKNTDINGMDVSDMTVEEAEKLIKDLLS